jgi:hypothetical protein
MPPPLKTLTEVAIRALRALPTSNSPADAARRAGVTSQYMSLLIKDPRSQPYLKEMGISGYEKRDRVTNPPSPYAGSPLKKFKFHGRDHDEEFLLTDTDRKLLEAYHQIKSPRKASRLAGIPVTKGAPRISKLTRNPKGQRYIAYLQGEPYDHIEIPRTSQTPVSLPYGLSPRQKEALDFMHSSESLADAARKMGVGRAYMTNVKNSPRGKKFLAVNPLPYTVTPGGNPKGRPSPQDTMMPMKRRTPLRLLK